MDGWHTGVVCRLSYSAAEHAQTVSDILTGIGQTMPKSPDISKVQVCRFTEKLPKAASLPITALYPTAVLHGMSLRSATPLTHQTPNHCFCNSTSF